MSSTLRIIFFDAGNTLIRMNYPVIAAALGEQGVPVTQEQIQQSEWRARVRLDREVLRRSAPHALVASTEDQSVAARYFRYLLDELGVTDPATIERIAKWRDRYNLPVGLWNAPEPAAEAALELVRAAGVRAAVISNSNGSVRSILADLGLTRWLEFVIDSQEVGVEKPDPEIFRLALERSAVRAEEAAYIGDLYSVDVLGARAAGMRAILLDPGACWGEPDCVMAADVLAAVRRLVDASANSSSSVDA